MMQGTICIIIQVLALTLIIGHMCSILWRVIFICYIQIWTAHDAFLKRDLQYWYSGDIHSNLVYLKMLSESIDAYISYLTFMRNLKLKYESWHKDETRSLFWTFVNIVPFRRSNRVQPASFQPTGLKNYPWFGYTCSYVMHTYWLNRLWAGTSERTITLGSKALGSQYTSPPSDY